MKYTEKNRSTSRRNTHKWWKLVKKSGNGGYMHKIHLLSIKRGSCEWKFWFLLFVSWGPPQALIEAWSASSSHTHTPTFSISLHELQGPFSPRYGAPLDTLLIHHYTQLIAAMLLPPSHEEGAFLFLSLLAWFCPLPWPWCLPLLIWHFLEPTKPFMLLIKFMEALITFSKI